jgi:hypothetical protein
MLICREFSAVLQILIHFSCNAAQLLLKTCHLLTNLNNHFIITIMHIYCNLAFGHCLLFWEADFHKVNSREALCRSRNDLNTLDNRGTDCKSFSTSTEQGNACGNLVFLLLKQEF